MTISLDDQLAKDVRSAAKTKGISVGISAFIAETLADALKREETSEEKPFRLVTVRGGRPQPGIDLDRPREIETSDNVARYGSGIVDSV